jgi:polysaccharide biosynthesis protein PslH
MNRILFLSPRQACPPTSGAKLREYYLARALSREAALTWIYFSEPGPKEAATPDFPADLIPVPRPKAYTPYKIAAGLLGRWPLPVVNYTSGAMRNAIIQAGSRHKFDLVHIDAIHLAAYTPLLQSVAPGVPIVYDWHNIESELMYRYVANTKSRAKQLYAMVTARRLATVETRLLASPAGHIVCSERERLQLNRIAPEAQIATIDNGVDTSLFHDTACANERRDSLLFVGAMAYHANIEAVVWFSKEVWPRLHSEWPELRLVLVGSNPVKEVMALATIGGVEVTGTVPDVRPYYRKAIAAIAPLRTAGGTRLKILEAMAARVPVISTAIGAEGLDVSPSHNIFIAEQADDWSAALRSLSEPDVWTRVAQAGLDLARDRYDWDVLGKRLRDTYNDWKNTG